MKPWAGVVVQPPQKAEAGRLIEQPVVVMVPTSFCPPNESLRAWATLWHYGGNRPPIKTDESDWVDPVQFNFFSYPLLNATVSFFPFSLLVSNMPGTFYFRVKVYAFPSRTLIAKVTTRTFVIQYGPVNDTTST